MLIFVPAAVWARGTVQTVQITGPSEEHGDTNNHAHTFSHSSNFERLINLKVMILGSVRTPEYPERTHANTGRKIQKSCRKTSDLLTARHRCYQLCTVIMYLYTCSCKIALRADGVDRNFNRRLKGTTVPAASSCLLISSSIVKSMSLYFSPQRDR